MSELEDIARHIVRREEERQVEKIKLESERKSLEEVLKHGISTEFVEEEVIYIYSPKTAHDMREKLEENYNQLHAQLTIPKSIADLADKEAFADSHTKFKIFIERYELNRLDRHLNLYCCTEEGRETIFAYMNPSTRDLVKVVEG